MSAILHFEDFAVGQRFALGPMAVTAEAIKDFACEFDPQPFHLDEAQAEDSVLGGLSASGFHTGALLLRMICDSFLSRSSILGSPGMERLTWLRPVHSGDILSGHLEVTGLRPSQSRPAVGVMTFHAGLAGQDGAVKAELAGTFFFGRRPS